MGTERTRPCSSSELDTTGTSPWAVLPGVPGHGPRLLEWQLPPPLAALVCPAGELGRAAAMATAELLCCDIRAGVKSGTGRASPQDTCGGSTVLRIWLKQRSSGTANAGHHGGPGHEGLAARQPARPPSPSQAAGDGAPHRGGAPLSCRISRSQLATPFPAGGASVPTQVGDSEPAGGGGQGNPGSGPVLRPPPQKKDSTLCLGRGAPSIKLTVKKRNWGAACGPQEGRANPSQGLLPGKSTQELGCGVGTEGVASPGS